jgi:hypothetical protein
LLSVGAPNNILRKRASDVFAFCRACMTKTKVESTWLSLVLRGRKHRFREGQQFVDLRLRGMDVFGRLITLTCDSRWRKSLTKA